MRANSSSTPVTAKDGRPYPPRSVAARRPAVLHRLLVGSRRVLEADAIFLLSSEAGGQFLRPVAAVGLSPGSLASFRRVPLRANDLCLRRVVTTGRPLVTHSMPDRCELSRVGRGEVRARSAMVVPVRSGGRIAGVLVVMWRTWKAMTRGERLAVEATANLLMPVLRHDLLELGMRRVDRARELRAFCGISRLGSTGVGPVEVARRGLRELSRALKFTRADLWLLGNTRRKMRLFATYGQHFFKIPQRVDVRKCAFTMKLLRRHNGMHHPDVMGSRVSPPENWSPWAPVTSVFGAPLRARNRVFGVLTADRNGRRFEMTATELLLGSVLSSLLAEVIYSAIDRQTRARRHRLMAMLGRAGYVISVEERLPVLTRRLTRLVRDRTGAHGVLIELFDEHTREPVVAAACGPDETRRISRRVTVRGPGSRAPAGRTVARHRPFIVEEVRELPVSPARWRWTRSLLTAPIRSRERVLGVLSLESRRPYAFEDDDAEVLSILGEQIGQAVKRARTLDALHSRQADLTAVSADLEKALEEERRRIARELHDELAQSMTAAKINLGLLEELTGDGSQEVCRTIRETATLIDRTIAETRRISMDLRPAMLDDLGLLPALRWYADTFSRRTGVRVTVRNRGGEQRAGRPLETLLYRFVQEALTNVARHSGARRVRLDLSAAGGWLRAAVADDGVGMSAGVRKRAGGQGLLGMRERIERARGRFRIESRRGRGTRLVAELPLNGVRHRAALGRRPVASSFTGSVA